MTTSPTPTPPSPEENYFHRLFDLSLDLLCVAGLDGYFKQVNPSWTRILGWSREELLTRPVEYFMHPDDRERTLQARARLAQGIPVRGLENRYLCKDGSYRWLSWQSSLDAGASMVFAVARDITERRLLDQERLIVDKLQSTGVLAGGIAHDFNNLLASILLNMEMAAISGPTTEQQRQLLQNAQQNVHAAKALTRQLITFAEGGEASRKTTDLKKILPELLSLALNNSNVRGDIQLAGDLWPADVDEAQIGQVVQNLIANAREAMPEGGTVHLRAENVILDSLGGTEIRLGKYLHISIRDEGGGISPEILSKVFDPYFSTKQRGLQRGMGLGLSICHAIIQKHGGTMTVDSQPGRGTTVHCHLPASRAPLTTSGPAPKGSPTASRKILVMDDEPGLREVIFQTLVKLGYTVELAGDGHEAVALYQQARENGDPFAAVLLDLNMKGGMDGSETMELLRFRDPAVRAVLMTGSDQGATFRHPALHGFQGTIAKPFKIEQLQATLDDVLGVNESGS